MSRFNTKAYDKLFPRTQETVQPVETAVEGFKPSHDDKPVDSPEPQDPKADVVKDDPLPDPVPDPGSDPEPDNTGGGDDGI